VIPEARLQEIEARAHRWALQAERDVCELVAEVRRLRGELELIRDTAMSEYAIEIARAALTEESPDG
jgi:hypothetical protein